MAQEPAFKATTYFCSPGSNAGAVTPDNLALISNRIRHDTTDVINLGENATTVTHLDPTRFIPANEECHVLTLASLAPSSLSLPSTSPFFWSRETAPLMLSSLAALDSFVLLKLLVNGSDGESSSDSSIRFTPPGTPAAAAGNNNNNNEDDDRDFNSPAFFDLPFSQLTVASGTNWSPL